VLELYQHQKDAIAFAQLPPRDGNLQSNALLWHEVGLGKTYASLLIAEEQQRQRRTIFDANWSPNPKILLVAPKFLMSQWSREIHRFVPHMYNDFIFHPYSRLSTGKGLGYYYDIRTIIFDEWHYAKNKATKRVRDLQTTLTAIATAKGRFGGGKIISLTGTPMPNSAAEMYTAWALLGAPTLADGIKRLGDNKRYMEWVSCFTQRELKEYKKEGKTKYGYDVPKGTANEDKLFELISPFTHHRKAEHCLDLPELLENYIDLDIDDDKLLADADIKKPIAYMAFVERITRAKVPHAQTWIDDFIENNPGERLLVFCPYIWALKQLNERYKSVSNLVIADNSKQHPECERAYNDGTKPILLGTYGSMSTGRNLQAGCHSLYIGYPWSPKIVRQAQGRTNRSGQTRKTRHNFLMSGQNDRKVLALLREKEEGITAIEDQFENQDRGLCMDTVCIDDEILTAEDLV